MSATGHREPIAEPGAQTRDMHRTALSRAKAAGRCAQRVDA